MELERKLPEKGTYVVGLKHNQLLGSTAEPPLDNGEIVGHLFFANSYSKEEAMQYGKRGFTVFIVEAGFRLSMVDFFPDVPKLIPFEFPKEKKEYTDNNTREIFARTISQHGCKFCSIRYLEVGINASVCEVCKKHLKCSSCGRCICEDWS